jgi:hypothetical protein
MRPEELSDGPSKEPTAEGTTEMTIRKKWIREWAARYPAGYDAKWVGDLGGKVRPSYEDVGRAVRWKSRRNIGSFARNDHQLVEETVARALGCRDDLGALTILTVLNGVSARVASGILAALRPERFTVMDRWAWASLRSHGLLSGFDDWSWGAVWLPYLRECRRVSNRTGLPLREVDRALWAARGRTQLPS